MSSTWNETEERISRGNPNLCFACEGSIGLDQPENAVKHYHESCARALLSFCSWNGQLNEWMRPFLLPIPITTWYAFIYMNLRNSMTTQPVNFYEAAMQCLWQMENSFIWCSLKCFNSVRREKTKKKNENDKCSHSSYILWKQLLIY